jgi:Domain of unknown function (DUF1963)
VLDQLAAAWSDAAGWRPDWTLQVGGHPNFHHWNPFEAAREAPAGDDSGENGAEDASDWALLATWWTGEDVRGLDFGLVHWVIRRRDLAALRFDWVYLYIDMV